MRKYFDRSHDAEQNERRDATFPANPVQLNNGEQHLSSTRASVLHMFRWRRKQTIGLVILTGFLTYLIFLWIPSMSTGDWHLPSLREKYLDILPVWLQMALSYLLARAAPSVDISQGTVVGTILSDSTLPRPVEAFLGVPYGQPPGRFRRAQAVKPSKNVINASNYGKRYCNFFLI